jgi:cytochrome c556
MRWSLAVGVAGLCALAGAGIAATGSVARDSRETLALSRVEREHMLKGMRIYLESVQGIVEALASNDMKRVKESAARSGNKLLEGVDPATAIVVPLGFTAMSMDTHEKFDALAAKVERGSSRIEVLGDLNAILSNCTTCHTAYRIAPAK